MKLNDAMRIINGMEEFPIGHQVVFFWQHGEILGKKRPDGMVIEEGFPAIHEGEQPIATQEEAQWFADKIARKLGNRIADVRVEPVYA